jgi:hypothetical protein
MLGLVPAVPLRPAVTLAPPFVARVPPPVEARPAMLPLAPVVMVPSEPNK